MEHKQQAGEHLSTKTSYFGDEFLLATFMMTAVLNLYPKNNNR